MRPQTKEEMDKVLQVSLWPTDTFDLFEDNERNIYAHYTKYQYSSIQYLKNFNRLLDMVQISEEFMPTYVMPKKGTNALIDYFLGGFPHAKYAWTVFKSGVDEVKRNDPKISWEQITELYMQVIRETGLKKKQSCDLDYRFSSGSGRLKMLPPSGIQYRRRKEEREQKGGRHDRVQHMARSVPQGYESGDEETSVQEESSEADHLDDADGYETGGGYDTAPEEEGQYQDKKSSGQGLDVEAEDSEPDEPGRQSQDGEDYLHAVVGKDGKGVCFEFARTGDCAYKKKHGKCGYSHDPEDVAKFKAAELLGPNYRARSGSPRRSSVSVAYNPGHKGTSPGMRPPFRKRASSGAQRSGRRDV